MVFGYIDYLAARERHRDLLRQAERDRLLRMVRQERNSGLGERKLQSDPLTFRKLAGSLERLTFRARKRIMAAGQPALPLCCGCGTTAGQRCD